MVQEVEEIISLLDLEGLLPLIEILVLTDLEMQQIQEVFPPQTHEIILPKLEQLLQAELDLILVEPEQIPAVQDLKTATAELELTPHDQTLQHDHIVIHLVPTLLAHQVRVAEDLAGIAEAEAVAEAEEDLAAVVEEDNSK
jgi:hypothetical protein